MADDIPATRPTGRTAIRATRILKAYASGCLVAAVAFLIGLIGHDVVVLGPAATFAAIDAGDVVRVVGFAFAVGAVAAAPFAAPLIAFAEIRGIRSVLAHALFGAAVAVAAEGLLASMTGGLGRITGADLALFAVVGAAGGVAYRAIALEARSTTGPARTPTGRAEPRL